MTSKVLALIKEIKCKAYLGYKTLKGSLTDKARTKSSCMTKTDSPGAKTVNVWLAPLLEVTEGM